MDAERFLKWIFEAPADVIWPEEFEAWEMQQEADEILREVEADLELRDIHLTEEQSEKMYNAIMAKIKRLT